MDWNTIFWIVSIVCFIVVLAIVIDKILKSCNQKPIPYPQEIESERVKNERDRIISHRNKRTLIIPAGTPAEDKAQIQYFATGKGFVNGDSYKA